MSFPVCTQTSGRQPCRDDVHIPTQKQYAKTTPNPEGVTEHSPGCQPRGCERHIQELYRHPAAGRRGVLGDTEGWKRKRSQIDCHAAKNETVINRALTPLVALCAPRLPATGCQYGLTTKAVIPGVNTPGCVLSPLQG